MLFCLFVYLFLKGEQGTAELGTNTVLKQTTELCFQRQKLPSPTVIGQNHASRWIRDLWSKGISLILAYLQTFLSFCVLDYFSLFSQKRGFLVFLVHPSLVSVLLSASVERVGVSRMRDFQSIGPLGRCFLMCVCLSVCLSVCVCVHF